MLTGSRFCALSYFFTRSRSSRVHFFDRPPLTESLEQASTLAPADISRDYHSYVHNQKHIT